MRAILVEDEVVLREQLLRLLSRLWPELEVVAQAGDGERALELIEQHQPDLLFLDIQIPGRDGLQLAAAVAPSTRVVFVTAYDQYAVEAFERDAIDYLLKPVSEQRLLQTIERIKQRESTAPERVQQMAEPVSVPLAAEEALVWIKALKGDVVEMVHIDEVLFFHAEDKYTTVATARGEYLIRKTIKALEQIMEPSLFWRVHRSTIVRVDAIASSRRDGAGGYLLTLRGSDRTLKVSRAHAHRFRRM